MPRFNEITQRSAFVLFATRLCASFVRVAATGTMEGGSKKLASRIDCKNGFIL